MVHITSIVDIAKMVGSSRLLRGYAITSPLSDFNLSPEDEKQMRKKYVEKAIEMLQQPGQKDHYETI